VSMMRRVHLAAGVLTAIAFLASGAYMRLAVDPDALAPGEPLLYISRHIYMLGNALVHLVLAAYVQPMARASRRRLQWAGTTLLVVSSVLLMAAFLVEPIAGRGRTAVSALGIDIFGAGSILHVIAAWRGRNEDAYLTARSSLPARRR
jgi:hypothetical protein